MSDQSQGSPVTSAPVAPVAEVVAPVAPEALAPKEDAQQAEFSRKFSALAKKEKSIYQKQAELKARESEIEKQIEARVAAKIAEVKKMSPLERLKFIETDYSDLTSYILNDGRKTPEQEIKSVKQELEEFKAQQEQARLAKEEESKKQAESEYVKVIEDFKTEITEYIDSNKDTYELISIFGAQEIVYETIDDYFTKTKKVLSIEEAANEVEKYLEGEAAKANKAKKLMAMRQEAPKAPAAAPASPSKTLSNQIAAQPTFIGHAQEEDRFKRALAALDRKS